MSDDLTAKDKVLQQLFDLAARDPWQWLLMAKDLGSIAEETWKNREQKPTTPAFEQTFVLGREYTRVRISFALLGTAFENIFKAIIVMRNPNFVTNGTLSTDFPATHDLNLLLNKVDWTLRPEEVFLLRRLSAYILWFSKYPVPKSFEKLAIAELNHVDFERGIDLCARLLNLAVQEIMPTNE